MVVETKAEILTIKAKIPTMKAEITTINENFLKIRDLKKGDKSSVGGKNSMNNSVQD